jgi:hypothetical protein
MSYWRLDDMLGGLEWRRRVWDIYRGTPVDFREIHL